MVQYRLVIESPIGPLTLISDEKFLKEIRFEAEDLPSDSPTPELLREAERQLRHYFDGRRTEFDLPLDGEGSDFQKRVWHEVSQVGFGQTRSYMEIARMLGSEKFSRAVGAANGNNPLPIVVPCHRIIGHNGKLTGYAGGLDRKKWLLLHEQRTDTGRLF